MKLFFLIALLPLVIFAKTWQIKTISQYMAHHQAQYRYLKLTNKNTKKTFYINMVLLNKNQYRTRIVTHHLELTHILSSRVYDVTKNAHAFLGINGGFFTPSYEPLGLLIINGKVRHTLVRTKLLSGLVLIDQKGQLQIKPRGANYKHALFALQSGPFLIRPTNRMALRKRGAVERRTAIALTSKNNLLIISTTPTTLYDLAYILKHQPNSLGVKKINVALNLDGGSSTAFSLFIPGQKPIIIPEFFPVENVLLFYLNL